MSGITFEKFMSWVQTLEDPGERFAFEGLIGEGNSSMVHKAIDPEGRPVAIKIVEESDGNQEDIYMEHSVLAETCNGNPRFPIFFGAFRVTATIPHQVWFVMEYCEEGTALDLLLKLRLKDKVLPEEMIAYIMRETLQSVKELHDQGVIHRDIKAANILFTRDGNVKLTDFGLSRHVGAPDGKLQSTAGCPYYMAPEVSVSERSPDLAYDSRADVWSLGITAAEMGDGVAPLSDVYPPRALFQVVHNPPPTLKKPQDWSQLYNDFIAECLTKNQDHRAWAAELVEHPFFSVAADIDKVRNNLLALFNEVRNEPAVPRMGEVTVKSEMIKMDRSQAPQRLSVDDLATLHRVSEDTVMEALHQRFAEGNIYTYLGDILITINPFGMEKFEKHYNMEVASKYKYKARCDNAPHIYAVADLAYQDMLHHQEVQNIILTGETGSGKSTAGKHILWHLANLSASNKKMMERIMRVETVLHAFGNGTTVFNDRATGYIQYLELTFTKTGKLSGGIVSLYGLKKYRVTSPGRNQSNFHIFYYLLDTLTATDQLGKYQMPPGTKFEYLPECPSLVPQQNVQELRHVKEAFNVLDFSFEEQETIVKTLCAILLLGQVKFQGDNEAEVEDPGVVESVASLLEVDEKKLCWTLANYCVVVNGESVRARCSVTEAIEVRDSLARSMYCRLVDWIVNLINTKLSFTRLVFGDQHSLGVLDIPGFECFAQNNTLDQCLVNMNNEQMQFFYNQRVFIHEMFDYEREELSVASYNYHDNRELLDSVLSKPVGLLAFLDEETKKSHNDPTNFLEQIHAELHTPFIKKAEDAISFVIAHYSGQVVYDARNFIERNKNFLSPEVTQVMRLSKNQTVVQFFSNLMTKTGNLTITDDDVKQTRWTSAISTSSHQNKRFNTKSKGKYSQTRQMQTVAATMRNSLLELLQRVSVGSPHFVRCIRSNLRREPMAFDRDLVRYQLRALGVCDTIRVRQLGYSRRLKFADFLSRYKFLAFDFDEKVDETKDNCRLLLVRLKMEGWALGKTRVFLKYYNEEFLSRLYESQVHKIIKVQSMMRAFLARKKTTSKFPKLAMLRQVAQGGKKDPALPGSVAGGPGTYGAPGGYPHRLGSSLAPKYGNQMSYSGRSTRNTTPVLFEGSERGSSPGYYNQRVHTNPAPISYMNYDAGRAHAYPTMDAGYSRPTDLGLNYSGQPTDAGYYRPAGGFTTPRSPGGHSPTRPYGPSYGPPSPNPHSPSSQHFTPPYYNNRPTSPSPQYAPPQYSRASSPGRGPQVPPQYSRASSPGRGPQVPSQYSRASSPGPHTPQQYSRAGSPGPQYGSAPNYNPPRSPGGPRNYHQGGPSGYNGGGSAGYHQGGPAGYHQGGPAGYNRAGSNRGDMDPYNREGYAAAEVDTTRPPSPRDIAKAFEQAAKENERSAVSGRYRQSGSLSPSRSSSGFVPPGYGQNAGPRGSGSYSQGVTSPPMSLNSPEIINPLEEFTNMANKMSSEGQFNYQARLRKADAPEPNQMNFDFRRQNNNNNGRGGSVPPLITTEPPEEEHVRVQISPGVVIEGICEDL